MKLNLLVIVLIVFSLSGYSQSKKELQEQIKALTTEKNTLQNDKIKLAEQVLELKQQILDLRTENLEYKNSNEKLQAQLSSASATNSNNALGIASSTNNNNSAGTKRCKAITSKGTQCSRNADSGSEYCWQHKSTYEPNNTSSAKSSTSGSSTSYKATSTPSSTSSGRTIYTGSRGGRYYINKNGNKTYIKK